jgi:hypothetical protein
LRRSREPFEDGERPVQRRRHEAARSDASRVRLDEPPRCRCRDASDD